MKIRAERARTSVAAIVTAVAVTLGSAVIGAQPVSAQEAASAPDIVRTVSSAGFAHPGVGFTADHLENMRTQVLADVDPWASYYDAMTETRYAARDFRAENAQPGTDTPKNDAYASASMRSSALRDSIGAMTQALQYVVTGDEVYRANALRVIRTWSGLDPQKYAYFGDAHIHTGVPLYYMLIAAEIVRGTVPSGSDVEGYDLTWTATDQQRLVDNFIHPTLDTFLASNNRLWNQHLYGVIGMVAAAIYLDDAELYAERVEWFTVNSGYESEHDLYGGDVNGALASIFREIPANHPGNTTGTAFVQHMEMLRDQAHGQGDVDILVALARLVNNQDTKLDPVAGTVSTASDAVSPYRFLDDRILAGADTFYAFMMGEEVPYVPANEGGAISQAYRGRLQDPLSETYLQYRFAADVDVAQKAPHVAELYEQRDGPKYFYGSTVQNFWNDRGSDYTGAEYWVAFPPELADAAHTVRPLTQTGELDVANFGAPLGAGAQRGHDDDGPAYIRLDAATEDARLAVRRAIWSDRTKPSLVGIRVRSDGSALLAASRTADEKPFAQIHVPDTQGEWRYVWVDLDINKTPGAIGENILFLQAMGSEAHVDVAGVLASANGVLTPPVFEDAPSLRLVAMVDEPWSRSISTTDSGGHPVEMTLQDAPAGAAVTGSAAHWTPQRTGIFEFSVAASDGTTVTALPISVTVTGTRQGAIAEIAGRVGDRNTYTSTSWTRMSESQEAVRDAEPTANAADFAVLLEAFGDAVDELVLLNPTLGDGSLDFTAIASAPTLTLAQILAITDGDNQTSWGDQRVTSVQLDFGPAFRVNANAFGFLARDTFPNRAQGTNVYGSDDATNWTLLTEHPNVGQDSAMEWIATRAETQEQRFRFLKFQVDEPGVPSDPAYPGIWSIADIRIEGSRSEAVGAMDKVEIRSADAVAGRVVAGDVVEVLLEGPAGNSAVSVSVLGAAAAVTSDSPGRWRATAPVPVAAAAGGNVTFEVSYTAADGRPADPIAATTNGSALYLSSDVGLIDDAVRGADSLRPDGTVDAAWTLNAGRMFDGNAATHSDTRLNAGTYGHVWDFGADVEVSLDKAELLVRQDGYGISRIADLRLEGSDDLTTWTRLTPAAPAKTLDWQKWPVADDGAYRYVRIANGQILGIAELRLYGVVIPVDVTGPTVTVKGGPEFTVGSDGLYRMVSFSLQDEGEIDRVFLNGAEKDLEDNAWSDLNFVTPGMFGATEGANRLVVFDVAGNSTTVDFGLDATGPTVSVKTGENYTVGTGGTFSLVSFTLHDSPSKIDRLTLNGKVKDLTNNLWSDLNFVKPGAFGAVAGENALTVFDSLGNATTMTFTLAG